MKAKTRKTLRKITVEYRYPSTNRNGQVASAGHNIVLNRKRTIILDKYSGVLTVRESGRFTREKKRFFTPEQLREIIISVQTGGGNVPKDGKTATVQIVDKTTPDSPILLLLKEPYQTAFALASEFSELLDLELRRTPVALS